MTQADLLREKREDIIRIAKNYGASNVCVFGSVARGEADERSALICLSLWNAGEACSAWLVF